MHIRSAGTICPSYNISIPPYYSIHLQVMHILHQEDKPIMLEIKIYSHDQRRRQSRGSM